jgi:hypothetical protein
MLFRSKATLFSLDASPTCHPDEEYLVRRLISSARFFCQPMAAAHFIQLVQKPPERSSDGYFFVAIAI